jgi:hypothetical protein
MASFARWHRHDAVRFPLAVLLLAGAALKAQQLRAGLVVETGMFASRWFLIAVIEFEVLLGLSLLLRLWPRSIWRVSLTCFAMFALASLYEAASGSTSCGCFGMVQVNPWITFAVDLAAMVALTWSSPVKACCNPAASSDAISPATGQTAPANCGFGSRPQLNWKLTVLAALFFAINIPAAIAMKSVQRVAMLDDSGEIVGGGGTVLLDPTGWVGKPFPLLRHIDIGDRLLAGNWVVVLFRPDCSKCADFASNLRENGVDSEIDENGVRRAFIEVPSSRTNGPPTKLSFGADLVGKLSDNRAWITTTPQVFRIRDGTVRSVSTDGL